MVHRQSLNPDISGFASYAGIASKHPSASEDIMYPLKLTKQIVSIQWMGDKK
jgi:hypothetical protein